MLGVKDVADMLDFDEQQVRRLLGARRGSSGGSSSAAVVVAPAVGVAGVRMFLSSFIAVAAYVPVSTSNSWCRP